MIIRGRAVTSLGANPWLHSDDVLEFAWLYSFLSFSFFGLGCLSSGMPVCQTNFCLCQELLSFIPFWKNHNFAPSLILFLKSGKKTQTNQKTPTPPIWDVENNAYPACGPGSMVFLWCFLYKVSFFCSTLPPQSPTYPPPSANLDWGSILSLPWMGRKIIYQKRRA